MAGGRRCPFRCTPHSDVDPVVDILLRLLLTAVLVMSLVGKLRDYGRFRDVVARYQVLPARLTGAACAFVLFSESAAVVGLWAWSPAGATLAGLLFAIYALAITVNILRGRTHIDCGCEWGGGGRSSTDRLTPWLPIRNLGLVLVALAILGPVSGRPLGYPDYGLIAIATTFFSVAFLVLDHALRQWLALRATLAQVRRPADA